MNTRSVIAITGGSGFVGSSLRNHLSQFFDVKVLDVRPARYGSGSDANSQTCDIRNLEELRNCLEGVDLVIHAAIIQIPAINEQRGLGYEVNVLGTQNVCKAVDENRTVKGMILSSSWHVMGESALTGVIDEGFGMRPDRVESRARLYSLAKIAQESITRFYDEMSEKVFGIVRMGTVLGEGMPENTAANIFIRNSLMGKSLTPFAHSMFRPMFYVDVNDVCKTYEKFATKILNGEIPDRHDSFSHIYNVFFPVPVTILELAQIVADAISRYSERKVRPQIQIVETGQPRLFTEEDKNHIKADVRKALQLLELASLKSPSDSINDIVRTRISRSG